MKASTYVRRHIGALPDAILDTLMRYHGCSQHNGPDSKACLADFLRTDLVMDVIEAEERAKTDLAREIAAGGTSGHIRVNATPENVEVRQVDPDFHGECWTVHPEGTPCPENVDGGDHA